MEKALTLYELNNILAECIRASMSDSYWVEAELASVREVGGHCYMELVQKDDASRTPIAKASAICWRNVWHLLRLDFEQVTGQQFKAGIKVMLNVHANFHEAFGFSWIVSDINPEFTIGDLVRRRNEIIKKLKEEGVFDLQKELCLPMFAQRIAVISSANAAGYEDFCTHLRENDNNFLFDIHLFPAIMQGEQVQKSVIAALNQIYERIEDFDVVVIIRGGGATSDLSGFDTLALSENVANFPLPIITGIGHERDESIVDMVAYVRVKTPTAAAALLVDNLQNVWSRIENSDASLQLRIHYILESERNRILRLSEKLPILGSTYISLNEAELRKTRMSLKHAATQRVMLSARKTDSIQDKLRSGFRQRVLQEGQHLLMLEKQTKLLDPQLLLKRGYSITTHNGKILTSSGKLKAGDVLETTLASGKVKSIVQK